MCYRRALGVLFLAVGAVVFASGNQSSAAEKVSLRIGWTGTAFAFEVSGAQDAGGWLLQFSEDGMHWQDTLFLEPPGVLGGPWLLEVTPSALPVRHARRGLFRAVEYVEVDPFYRDYLAARSLWRASGLTSYRYEFRWSTMIFWRGTVDVVDGAVSSYKREEAFPPFFEEPPLYESIDGLFDRIGDAWRRGAASIEVTWDREYGYPRDAAIDQSLLIADEEQYWSIESIGPVLP